MKHKKVYGLLATVFSFGLTVLAAPAVSAAGLTCTWTGGGADNNFSTTANWSGCSGAAPTNGDNLVFPVTASRLAPVNDISSLNAVSITFNGTGSAGYNITGNALTLSGDLTDNSSGAFGNHPGSLVLGTDAVFSGTHVPGGGAPLIMASLNLSTHNLSVDGIALSFVGALSGSGDLTLTNSGSVLLSTASAYSGAVTIGSGSRLTVGSTALGTGPITVQNGGNLWFEGSGSSDFTMNNDLTLAGTGISSGGALTLSGTTGTLTLANVILTANATAAPGTGKIVVDALTANSFSLTKSGATGTLTINNSTDGSAAGAAGDSDAATPKAPDTGFGLVLNNPLVVFVTTTGAALMLVLVARKLHATAR
jgi:hypothetical protein